MADVLDAMFEKNVKPGEFIIRQGDDGDNFYVIERWVLKGKENVIFQLLLINLIKSNTISREHNKDQILFVPNYILYIS